MYRKGDIVRVWSLQSFHGGGFIDGREGVVYQDQIGPSVIVSVARMKDGQHQIDPHYEVYAEQLKLVRTAGGCVPVPPTESKAEATTKPMVVRHPWGMHVKLQDVTGVGEVQEHYTALSCDIWVKGNKQGVVVRQADDFDEEYAASKEAVYTAILGPNWQRDRHFIAIMKKQQAAIDAAMEPIMNKHQENRRLWREERMSEHNWWVEQWKSI